MRGDLAIDHNDICEYCCACVKEVFLYGSLPLPGEVMTPKGSMSKSGLVGGGGGGSGSDVALVLV